MEKFRLVRVFANPLTSGPGQTSDRAYRVESEKTYTAAEALELLRELGSPYQK